MGIPNDRPKTLGGTAERLHVHVTICTFAGTRRDISRMGNSSEKDLSLFVERSGVTTVARFVLLKIKDEIRKLPGGCVTGGTKVGERFGFILVQMITVIEDILRLRLLKGLCHHLSEAARDSHGTMA